jgi:hypothetical protein
MPVDVPLVLHRCKRVCCSGATGSHPGHLCHFAPKRGATGPVTVQAGSVCPTAELRRECCSTRWSEIGSCPRSTGPARARNASYGCSAASLQLHNGCGRYITEYQERLARDGQALLHPAPESALEIVLGCKRKRFTHHGRQTFALRGEPDDGACELLRRVRRRGYPCLRRVQDPTQRGRTPSPPDRCTKGRTADGSRRTGRCSCESKGPARSGSPPLHALSLAPPISAG